MTTEEKLLNDPEAPAILAEWNAADGHVLGVITLNVPKTLNSLTLDMIRIMDLQLRAWADDDRIAGIYLRGSGERAFCAGGDIQALYRSVTKNHAAGEQVDDHAVTFFEEEYRLDHLLHRYPKPVICFGNGVVMGGGLGLLSASSHPVVTETSRVAMPEITIGLFPDAGGTSLLTRMPGSMGLFLGLTGAQINGTDALEVGLGRFLIASDKQAELEQALRSRSWAGHDAAESLDALLAEFDAASRSSRPESRVAPNRSAIDAALDGTQGDYAAVIAGVRSLAGRDGWVDKGLATLEKGCPITAGIVVEQLARAQGMALADMFRMEMVIGTHCARQPDFAEGVRALLIDKDQTPKWSVASLDDVSRDRVLEHFEAPWEINPLADLSD
ncbi:MAG: enoyl-CoA hydratase/isomerase family protein [Gammaproteobacteria bacterium]|nr:enoyl-CoA hydratase/isomerase family protein [Gammaproteobacteria bacterium]